MPAEKVDLNTIPYAPPIPREPPPGLADTAFPVNTHLDRIFHPAGRPRASGRACGNTVHLGERRLFPERPRPLPPGIEIPGYRRPSHPGLPWKPRRGAAVGSPGFQSRAGEDADAPERDGIFRSRRSDKLTMLPTLRKVWRRGRRRLSGHPRQRTQLVYGQGYQVDLPGVAYDF